MENNTSVTITKVFTLMRTVYAVKRAATARNVFWTHKSGKAYDSGPIKNTRIIYTRTVMCV